jgi:hypothetical protein
MFDFLLSRLIIAKGSGGLGFAPTSALEAGHMGYPFKT